MDTLQLHEKPTPVQDIRAGDPYHTRGKLSRLRLIGMSLTGILGGFRQVIRFGLVGGLNTVVDLLILNSLLLLFPTTSTSMLLAYNSLAYSVGAVNSFLLNKYWTFGQRRRTSRKELMRFALTTLCGIGWSSIILWIASDLLHPFLLNATIWANVSKVLAIGGTALISYLGMRLWVFVSKGQQEQMVFRAAVSVPNEHLSTSVAPAKINGDQTSSSMVEAILAIALAPVNDDQTSSSMVEAILAVAFPSVNGDQISSSRIGTTLTVDLAPISNHSLSIVLPAFNEEQVIAGTVSDILGVLSGWHMDFEVLVVNDGSTDRTGAIVSALADTYPQVHPIMHSTNQGYGAALVSGFTAATKELAFFMDSDGQFDIRDLRQFFSYIDEYDAVIGYRIDRQDSWMRKLNAWGWKLLIGGVLGVHVRDIDCAFKLLHTEFLRQYPLETRGAMINAELLYKLTRAGYCYREIGVHHHSRKGGRATGARPGVILHALRELFRYARKWQRELQRTPYHSRV